MNIEFLSKYGIVCEYAKLTGAPVLILVSGTFAPPHAWNFLEERATDDEGDAALAVMLSTTGLAVAKFESLEDIDTWVGDVQSRSQDKQHMNLMLAVVNAEGDLLEEGYLLAFPTTFTKGLAHGQP